MAEEANLGRKCRHQETTARSRASKRLGANYGTTNQYGGRSGVSTVWNAGGEDYREIREPPGHLFAVRGLRPDVGRAKRRTGVIISSERAGSPSSDTGPFCL